MMPTQESKIEHVEPQPADEARLRKDAVIRSCICPGAGFALIGKRTCAIAAFILTLCVVPVVAWLAFQPTASSLWTTIALVFVATGFSLVEQIVIKKAALRSPSPSILDRGFIASACVTWLVITSALVLTFISFGTLQIAGSGMAPSIGPSERFIYHKHVDWQSVKKGAIIVYRNSGDSAWGKSGWLITGRILAGPGDKIAIKMNKYFVNGAAGPRVAATGRQKVVLSVPRSPKTLTVPEDCYFIVQDSPTSLDSRVLSWVRVSDIVGSRLWYLSNRGIFKPIE